MDAFIQEVSNFINWFMETVSSLVNFLVSFVEDLVYVVDLTAKFVVKIPTYLNWLPSEVLSIIVICFGIVVVYKILGREG